MDFLITNLSDAPVILPTPVSLTIPPFQTINLGEYPNITGAEIASIKSYLNQLEQAGTINIQGVGNSESAIGAAAEEAGQMNTLVKKALNAQQEYIQFAHRFETLGVMDGGLAGGAGVECWLMITDTDGTPDVTADDAVMTVNVTGSGKIDGVSTSKAVTIVNGIAKFQVTDAVAETVTLSISGTPPNNVVFGTPLAYTDTQDVEFA